MNPNFIDRPRRWDTPFGADQTDAIVDSLLGGDPFALMSPAAFPKTLSLRGILRNDCRIVECEDGEIIIRQGDYGNSAFLLLCGQALVSLKSIPENILGRNEPRRRGVLSTISQLWRTSAVPERRRYGRSTQDSSANSSDMTVSPPRRVFLQDIPRVLDLNETETLQPGELFGELSALTRTPRSATVFAKGTARLVEIRWQGLRDLMRFDKKLKNHVERLYREHSLQTHLSELSLFQGLPSECLQAVAQAAEFETFGNFDWQNKFQHSRQEDIAVPTNCPTPFFLS